MKFKKTILSAATIFGLLSANLVANPAFADNTEGLTGTWSGYRNNVNVAASLDGDIFFGYDNGCNYGKFTHTAMAVRGSTYSNGIWDGPTVQSTSGHRSNSVITTGHQSDFYKYDAASLTYFSKSGYSFNGAAAADHAKTYYGPYNVLTTYTSNNYWFCSKLVSRAVYDYNGYSPGYYGNNALLPETVWYDYSLKQRSYSLSSHYDGGSVWSKTASVASASGQLSQNTASLSVTITDPNSKEIDYKGYKVYSKNFDKEEMELVDSRIKKEQDAGKTGSDRTIVLSDAKPGLENYLKELLKDGLLTKEQIKEKWNLSDSEAANL